MGDMLRWFYLSGAAYQVGGTIVAPVTYLCWGLRAGTVGSGEEQLWHSQHSKPETPEHHCRLPYFIKMIR